MVPAADRRVHARVVIFREREGEEGGLCAWCVGAVCGLSVHTVGNGATSRIPRKSGARCGVVGNPDAQALLPALSAFLLKLSTNVESSQARWILVDEALARCSSEASRGRLPHAGAH